MKPETFGRITLYNADCMDIMREMPDKAFDLAIVDPPYGLNFGTFNRTNKDSYGNRHKANKYVNGDWDKGIPTDEYWEQLFRITKNQIVWGGNYFPLPPCRGFVFWNKKNPVPNFSDGEFAWTSFNKPARCFDFRYYGNIQGNTNADPKIHPTQKPIELYKWLLVNYGVKPDGFARLFFGDITGMYDYSRIGFLQELPQGTGLLKKKKEGEYFVYAVDKRSKKGQKVIEVFHSLGASGDRLQELGIPLCYTEGHGTTYSDFNISKDDKGYFIRVNGGCLERLPQSQDFWTEVK